MTALGTPDVDDGDAGDARDLTLGAREGCNTTKQVGAIVDVCRDLVTAAVTIWQLAMSISLDPDLSDDTRRRLGRIAAESTSITERCAFELDARRRPNADDRGRAAGHDDRSDEWSTRNPPLWCAGMES